MFHLFQHTKGKLKGKYDFAFISKGRYTSGSGTQGYENKLDVYSTVMGLAKYFNNNSFHIQDDTGKKPQVMYAVRNIPRTNIIITATTIRAKKKYIP